jgi:hypothetical protein
MGKTTVAQGEFLCAGLNSFEPGQEHAPHAHEGEDKLSIGDAAFASSGALHSIRNPGPQRLVVLAITGSSPAPVATRGGGVNNTR